MIELINASKYYPTRFGRHYIFSNVSLKLPASANIGIIGPNGAGKSTLMRLLAGVDIPSEGRIVRTGKISWPLGLTPSLLPTLTGRENARFVCRIYGMTGREIAPILIRIAEVAGIGQYFDMPVRTYSSGMRSRLSFATSMAIEFDYYLFDEIGAPGDRAFKQLSKTMIDQRLATSKFIMSSHAPQELLDFCDSAILIGGGELRYFNDVRDALREYGENVDPARGQAGKPRKRPPVDRVPPAGMPADLGAAAPAAKPELPRPGPAKPATVPPVAGGAPPAVAADPKTVEVRRAVRLAKPPIKVGPGSQ